MKVSLDYMCRGSGTLQVHNEATSSQQYNQVPAHPEEFLRLIVPFLNWEQAHESRPFQAFVNPSYTLGANIGGYPEDLSDTEATVRAERYARVFGSIDDAHYTWYPDLGLFAAGEGKHRVAFMLHHRQPAIATWVSEQKLPCADRFAIVRPPRTSGSAEREWLIILDRRYAQVLRRPHISRPLLAAYGVREYDWSEIKELSAEREIWTAIYSRGLHLEQSSRDEMKRTLDLRELAEASRKVADESAEQVEWRIDQVAPLRLKVKRMICQIAAMGLVGGLCLLLPSDELRSIGVGILGVAVGLLSSPILLRLRGPRRFMIKYDNRAG
ncbi:hypothetical protein [Pseudomonas sp. LS-2]|uniref:hypothetical protein n=1 Tax=Pseudomonas sp. LS-2 TaxID=2315859 RepID=UPI000E73B330|nr:hypothetical protein [Pseudomonas sp. LS-2]RJX80337.1 hypothetical protein D3M70_12380 [Pseudomonas sp. LS-2]